MNASHQHNESYVCTSIMFQLFVYLGLFSLGRPIMAGPSPNAPEASAVSGAAGNQMTFVSYKYIDPMTKMEAFRLLIPKGWRATGEITWSANPALPAQSHFRFFNPQGHEQFEIFPTQSYF
ncbi:hypothetical protein ACFL3F_01955 [Planctomycetota bacterium]